MSPGQVDPVIERDNPGGYSLACAGTLAAGTETAVAAESKITILYDAFGDDAGMKNFVAVVRADAHVALVTTTR